MKRSILALALAVSACGGSSSPTSPQPVPTPAPTPTPAPSAAPAATDLTGTWRGTGSGGGARFTLTWNLEERGASVTGVSQFVDGSGFTSGNGRITGTVSGNQLTFTDVYPQGALANPACGETDSGTFTITGNRMEGTFRSESTCGRVESGTVVLTR